MNRASWVFSALAVGSLAASLNGCSTEAYCYTGCGEEAAAATGGTTGGFTMSSAGGHTGGLSFAGMGGNVLHTVGGGGGSAGQVACTADTQTDPANCGTCGLKCALTNAFQKCVKGACEIDSCAPTYYDLDHDPADGCEYHCTPTVPPTEVCDGMDNDCNGKVDDGIDKMTDPLNCGSCGNSCMKDLPEAQTTACVAGVCSITKCATGYADIDKLASDGCEYKCPVFPTMAETCNGKDDDCDGVVDNGNPGGGQPCTSTCPGGKCVGECTPGIQQCAGDGTYICMAGKEPSIEVCDGKDNDCNGTIDDGFDLMTDSLNCGMCGKACKYANAIGVCTTGMCKLDACNQGYANLDSMDGNGCEYMCPQAVPGAEVCDGIDNDCNGLVDAADPGLIVPTGVCNTKAGTPCAGTTLMCMGALGFRCSYDADVETDANGNIVPNEHLCDGKDGNCDGQIDETWPLKGVACSDGKVGACASTGTYVCDAAQDGLSCKITKTGVPSSAEKCNGIDDDCNGAVDDNLADSAFAMVALSGSTTVMVDQYEASHPDATGSVEGTQTTLSCSTADVMPWTAVPYAEALAACTARGPKYRLCTAPELEKACGDAANNAYPYGAMYSTTACNGADNGAPSALQPTGASLMCVTASMAFDLSGNATEWTSTKTGTTQTMPNFNIYQLQGGSFLSPPAGLACTIPLAPRASENAVLLDVGFRCCRDM